MRKSPDECCGGLNIYYNGKKWGETETFFSCLLAMIPVALFVLVCVGGVAVIIGALSKVFYLLFKFGWGFWL